ncbi:pentatricopeptide repeat-containing protein At1g73710 [Olea europaea var. sylvestris]|uniref:Pentatricopeptide repeat-containing At1g73710 n=1 Tax=Olea europaea subsp. europaea TaxID=158383 RepID=A0A8S0TP63_OLEEU|nr:pentatricopeptide repeat-containing protein At1g73710 [Olea europaea var. sylvestris]CAA3007091.1 pentatricopeptide repeat-containing At1g73710 [Olea europaea subsp. europaea]
MMTLHAYASTCSDLKLGSHENLLSCSSPCKLDILISSSSSRIFLGFSSHTRNSYSKRHCFLRSARLVADNILNKIVETPQAQKQIHSTSKLHSFSSNLTLPKKTSIDGKKKKYGGILPSILRSLASENDIEKTLDLYYGKLTPKEQTVILKEQKSWEKVLRIFEWFKSQKEYVPNVIHYNVVLRALGRAQKWDELRLRWIEMAKNGVVPTNNTYGMLVDVYGKAGLVKESLLWIKHMKLRGIFPDEVTMNTVVRVLKDAGEYNRADRFYKDWCNGMVELGDLDLDIPGDSNTISLKQFLLTELFRTGGRNNFSTLGGTSDVEKSVKKPRLTATYNTLIDLYGKAGRLKDASDVFEDMLKSGVMPDTFTFNTMIFICGTHGYLSEAEELLNKMEERGISPDTKTFNIFLTLYADVGNIDAVLLCYRKIREVGLFPDEVTHRAVLQILCERNMVPEVEAVIEEMENLEMLIDQNSLPVLIKMYVKEGLSGRANFLFEKCQANGWLSSRTYAAIIDVYAEKGLWAEAEAVFYSKRGVYGQKWEVLEYNVMIKAYGKAKLYDKAFLLFKGMRTHGTWPDECTYNSLIQMFAGGDLVDKARDLFVEMQKAGFKPSCSSFSAVIARYVHMERLSDAVDVFQEMLQADVKPNEVVYGSLIDGFAEAGKFEEAIHYFHVMEESGISVNQVVLTSMIKAYGKIGSVEGAKQLYEKIKKLNGGPDIVASNSMLSLYAELGMVSEAKMIYDHLKEKNWADGVTFATMMYVYKNMGMLDEAIEVAEEMKQSHLVRDCVTFNKVMACYATNGQLVECGELLHEMVVNRKLLPDGGTFKILFTILKKGGAPAEAVKQLESSYQEGRPYARQAVITSVFSVVGLHTYALESCDIFENTDLDFDSFAYNAAIHAYGALGKTDEALNMFMRMQDAGLEPDIVTFIYLVGCYGKAGMVEGVKRISSQLKYGAIEPNESLYQALIDAYKIANRHDLAELVHQEMRVASDEQQFTDSESEIENDPEESYTG